MTSLVSLDGDADLYVWGLDDQLWYGNNQAGLEDLVAFNAPITGTYQIEVHGYTAAHYRLTLGSGGVQSAQVTIQPSLRGTKQSLPDRP